MPYSSVSELPEPVRKRLSESAQRVFLAAFNAAFDEAWKDQPLENREAQAMRVAWAAVAKNFEENDDGEYEAVSTSVFTDFMPLSFIGHDAILQTLDRESKGVFLCKEHFEPSVDAWNDVPLILAQQHPDPKAYDKDAAAELKRIGGRLLKGHASETSIELTGHPRLMTTFKIEDKQINEDIAKGLISTSNGFWVRNDGKKTTGNVQPHHILFFYEKPEGPVPGDKGAFILNTDDPMDKKIVERLKALLFGSANGAESKGKEDMETKELEAKLATSETELKNAKLAFTQLQADVAKRDEENARLKAENEQMKTANLAFLAKEKDAKWNGFKSRHIPPGLVAKPEDEKALRDKFEGDPLSFTEDLLAAKGKQKSEGTEEGMEFTAEGGEAKAPRVGRYNPDTRKWE